MGEQYSYMVTTGCITYNHAPYILDAIHGFAIQKTSFPVVYTVIDDASTDGNQGILYDWANGNLECEKESSLWKEEPYAKVAVGRLKGNDLALFVIVLLRENHVQTGRKHLKIGYVKEWLNSSRYIAICEGDDYWIDPLKLQKQVDFMLAHPKSEMCYTNFSILYENGTDLSKSVLTSYPHLYPNHFTLEEWIVRKGYVGPMTWLISKDLYDKKPIINTVDGSFVEFCHYLASTEVGCLINDTTAVYRRTTESASHSKSTVKQFNYSKGLKNTQIALANYYKNILIDPERVLYNINKSVYNNKRYLILSAIAGDSQELVLAKKINRSPFVIILYYFSRFRLFRSTLNLVYKTFKKWHWFFYRKKHNLYTK